MSKEAPRRIVTIEIALARIILGSGYEAAEHVYKSFSHKRKEVSCDVVIGAHACQVSGFKDATHKGRRMFMNFLRMPSMEFRPCLPRSPKRG